MIEHFEAVYENGLLRPLQALDWPDQQHVTLTVAPPRADEALDGLVDEEAHAAAALEADGSISLQQVHEIMAKIPGSMAEFVSMLRDER